MADLLTKEEFFKRCYEKRGDSFDYTKTNFYSLTSKIIVTCRLHGDIETTGESHLSVKNPCKECAKTERLKIREEQYKNKLYQTNKYYREGVFEFIKIDVDNTEKGFFRSKYGLHRNNLSSLLSNVNLNGHSCTNPYDYYENLLKDKNKYYREGYFTIKDKFKTHKTNVTVYLNSGETNNLSIGYLLTGVNPRKAKTTKPITKQKISKKEKYSSLNLKRIEENRKDFTNIDYSFWNYSRTNTPVKFRCKIHDIIYEQRVSHHINNVQACPECKLYSSSGVYTEDNIIKLHPDRDGYLYVIKIYDEFESFYKVGITRRDLEERLKELKSFKYNVEIVYELHTKLLDAFYKEQYFLDLFREFKYVPLKYFGGHTECFSEDIWQLFYEWNCAEEERSRCNDKLMCEEHGIDYEQQLIP